MRTQEGQCRLDVADTNTDGPDQHGFDTSNEGGQSLYQQKDVEVGIRGQEVLGKSK